MANEIPVLGRLHAATTEGILTTANEIEVVDINNSKTTLQKIINTNARHMTAADLDMFIKKMTDRDSTIENDMLVVCTTTSATYSKGHLYMIYTNKTIEDLTQSIVSISSNGISITGYVQSSAISSNDEIFVNFNWSSSAKGYGDVNCYIDEMLVDTKRCDPSVGSFIIKNTYSVGQHSVRLEVIDSAGSKANWTSQITIGSFVVETTLNDESVYAINDTINVYFSYDTSILDAHISASYDGIEILNTDASNRNISIKATSAGIHELSFYLYYTNDNGELVISNSITKRLIVVAPSGIYLNRISKDNLSYENKTMFTLEFYAYSLLKMMCSLTTYKYNDETSDYDSYSGSLYNVVKDINNGSQIFYIAGLNEGRYKFRITISNGSNINTLDFDYNIYKTELSTINKIHDSLLYDYDFYGKSNYDDNLTPVNLVDSIPNALILQNFGFLTNESISNRDGYINNSLVFNTSSSAYINYRPLATANVNELLYSGFTFDINITDCEATPSKDNTIVSCHNGVYGFKITNTEVIFDFPNKDDNEPVYLDCINHKSKRVTIVMDVSNGKYYTQNSILIYIDSVLTKAYHVDINNKPICNNYINIGDIPCAIRSIKIYNKPLTQREILLNHAVDMHYDKEFIERNNLNFAYANILPQMTLITDKEDNSKITYVEYNTNKTYEYYAVFEHVNIDAENISGMEDYIVNIYSDAIHSTPAYIQIGNARVSKFKIYSSYKDTSHIGNKWLSSLPLNKDALITPDISKLNCYDGKFSKPVIFGIINASTAYKYRKYGLYVLELLDEDTVVHGDIKFDDLPEEFKTNFPEYKYEVVSVTDDDLLLTDEPATRQHLINIINHCSMLTQNIANSDNIVAAKNELNTFYNKYFDASAVKEFIVAKMLTTDSDVKFNKFVTFGPIPALADSYTDEEIELYGKSVFRPQFNYNLNNDTGILTALDSTVELLNLYNVSESGVTFNLDYIKYITDTINSYCDLYGKYIKEIPEIEFNNDILINQYNDNNFDLIKGNALDNLLINSKQISDEINAIGKPDTNLTFNIQPTTDPKIALYGSKFDDTAIEYYNLNGTLVDYKTFNLSKKTDTTSTSGYMISKVVIRSPESIKTIDLSNIIVKSIESDTVIPFVSKLVLSNNEHKNTELTSLSLINSDGNTIFPGLVTLIVEHATTIIDSVDLSLNTALEYISFEGTQCHNIIFPEYGVLETIILPNNMKNLKLVHQYNIETLSYVSLASLESLYIDDCNLSYTSNDSIIGNIIKNIELLPDNTIINVNTDIRLANLDTLDYIIDNEINSIKFVGTIAYTGNTTPKYYSSEYSIYFPSLTITYNNITSIDGLFAYGNNIDILSNVNDKLYFNNRLDEDVFESSIINIDSNKYRLIESNDYTDYTLLSNCITSKINEFKSVNSLNRLFYNNTAIRFITSDIFNVVDNNSSIEDICYNCTNLKYIDMPNVDTIKMSWFKNHGNLVMSIYPHTNVIFDDNDNTNELLIIKKTSADCIHITDAPDNVRVIETVNDPMFRVIDIESKYIYHVETDLYDIIIDSDSYTVTDNVTYYGNDSYNNIYLNNSLSRLNINRKASNVALRLSRDNTSTLRDIFGLTSAETYGIVLTLYSDINKSFASDTSFTSLTLRNVTNICESAFENSKFKLLSSIDGINIETKAFKNAVYENATINLRENMLIGEDAFMTNDPNINEIKLSISDTVTGTNISSRAFYNVKFADNLLTIPESYINFNNNVFSSDISNIETIILIQNNVDANNATANRFVINNYTGFISDLKYLNQNNVATYFSGYTAGDELYVTDITVDTAILWLPGEIVDINDANGTIYKIKAIMSNAISSTDITSIYFVDTPIEYIGSNFITSKDIVYLINIPESLAIIKSNNNFKSTIWYENLEDDVVSINKTLIGIKNFNYDSYSDNDTVDVIYDNAFDSNHGIESITISNASCINTKAFANCSKLKNINISGNIKYIASNAFEDSNAIQKIILNCSLENIGGYNLFKLNKNNNVNTFMCNNSSLAKILLTDNIWYENITNKLKSCTSLIFGSINTVTIEEGKEAWEYIPGLTTPVEYTLDSTTVDIPVGDLDVGNNIIDISFIPYNIMPVFSIIQLGLSFKEYSDKNQRPTLICNYDILKVFNDINYSHLFEKRFKTKLA